MLACIAGSLIVVLVISEMFKDLFKPARSGLLSRWIGRAFFMVFRRWRSMLPWALELMREVARIRIDFLHFPVIYYFASGDPDASIARWGPALTRIAEGSASASQPPAVRIAAHALGQALADLAALLGDQFLDLRDAAPHEVFAALARDHRVELA